MKNEIIIFLSTSKRVVSLGVNQFYLLSFLCFSLIYFSDIYINAKYKYHIMRTDCPIDMKQMALEREFH